MARLRRGVAGIGDSKLVNRSLWPPTTRAAIFLMWSLLCVIQSSQ